MEYVYAQKNDYFIVTAYYSPLPDQKYYITGSYESEVRLNGQGIAGASGKNVFSGMLAAPNKYSFGTKIELEGLGVGSVEDRGGAIVPAGKRGYSHDRIDVWVGYGDEGLRRAMYWGKRKIAGKVIAQNSNTTLRYNSIPAPSWAVPKTTTLYGKQVQVAQYSQAVELDIFSLSLGRGSDSKYVTKLQETLKQLGYYTQEDFTGIYDEHTINSVYNFQINNEIIKNEFERGAGSYGPKTRATLKAVYAMHLEELNKIQEFKENIAQLKNEAGELGKSTTLKIGNVSYGEISPEVRILQKTLQQLGYFDYKDTAIFGVKTRNALIEFQLENEVISSADSLGTGIFGPKTKETLIKVLSEYNFKQVLELEELTDTYEEVFGETEPNNISHEVGFTIFSA